MGGDRAVAYQLRSAAERAQLPAQVVARLQEASKLLGVEIVPESVYLERDDIADTLAPGARICFTGTVQDSAGRVVERWERKSWRPQSGSNRWHR